MVGSFVSPGGAHRCINAGSTAPPGAFISTLLEPAL
nr:MAG TPA: hypothetical protein [Caudoviricetes sp.]